MKFLQKFKFAHQFMILALASVMILTTAISFAYWKSDIDGAERGEDLPIYIGSGSSASAQLTLTPDQTSQYPKLIPIQREAQITDSTRETTTVTYSVGVLWKPIDEQLSVSSDYDGYLSVDIEAVNVGFKNFINEQTVHGNLFVLSIEVDGVAYTVNDLTPVTSYPQIKAGTPSNITITVRLNEPDDYTQYNAIAGHMATLSIFVQVISESEAGVVA